MTSAPVRDPLADHLLTPQNAALLLIDYQPAQLAAVRSMDHALLLKNAVSTVRTIKPSGSQSCTRPSMSPPAGDSQRSPNGAYAIRDFLSRNGYPFEWVDAGQPNAVRAVLGIAEVEPSALPLCILPDGSRLRSATVEQVAAGLGMVAAPSRSEYDLTIVGAGPAGLAAAVNAASEGLRTLIVEAVAPGGQAGTTSMIENYLGFPNGISGSELATRAVVQARRFGAELLMARPLVDVSNSPPTNRSPQPQRHSMLRSRESP